MNINNITCTSISSQVITTSVFVFAIGSLISLLITLSATNNNNDSHIANAKVQNTSSLTTTAATTPTLTNQLATAILGSPTNKTIYVFTSEHEGVNQTQLLIPPDSFSPSEIAVNKGDTVNIVFYNLETPPNGDRHSFTIGDPYNIDKDLGPGQHGTITFRATQDGTFQFFCKYHQPTMRGELIVLP